VVRGVFGGRPVIDEAKVKALLDQVLREVLPDVLRVALKQVRAGGAETREGGYEPLKPIAADLGVSTQCLCEQARKGAFHAMRIGRVWRARRADVEAAFSAKELVAKGRRHSGVIDINAKAEEILASASRKKRSGGRP
jgi:hypothetical protein